MLRRFFLSPFLFLTCCILSLSSCGDTKKTVYEIAFDPLWYPLDFQNKDNNVVGFSTELLRNVSKNSDLSFSLLQGNWDSLLSGLSANNYQAVLSSLYPYNFNLNQYDFSSVYLNVGPVLILPVSSPYKSLKDVQNKQIAVIANSPSNALLEDYPNVLISSCNSVGDVMNQLQSGQVVGALLPILTARGYTQGSFSSQFKIASPPLNNEGLRLITKKGQNAILIKKFNEILEKMKKEGTYERLLNEWELNTKTPS